MNTPMLIGYIIGQLLGGASICLLTAVFLRWAVRFAAGYNVPYRMAYKAALLSFIGAYFVSFYLAYQLGMAGLRTNVPALLLIMFFSLLVQAGVYVKTIRNPDGASLTFTHACGVSVIHLLIAIGVLIVPAVLVIAVASPTHPQKRSVDVADQGEQSAPPTPSPVSLRVSPEPDSAQPMSSHRALNQAELIYLSEARGLFPNCFIDGTYEARELAKLHAWYAANRPDAFANPKWPLQMAAEAQNRINGTRQAQ